MVYSIEIKDNLEYMDCEVKLEYYTPDNVAAVLKEILHHCILREQYDVFIDLTEFTEATPATLKSLAAMSMDEVFQEYEGKLKKHPRIAVLGVAPHVSTYKPVEDYFKIIERPFSVFVDKDEALRWLLSDDRFA